MCDAIILGPMQLMASKTVKRDWQVYDLYRKDEEALFLEERDAEKRTIPESHSLQRGKNKPPLSQEGCPLLKPISESLKIF